MTAIELRDEIDVYLQLLADVAYFPPMRLVIGIKSGNLPLLDCTYLYCRLRRREYSRCSNTNDRNLNNKDRGPAPPPYRLRCVFINASNISMWPQGVDTKSLFNLIYVFYKITRDRPRLRARKVIKNDVLQKAYVRHLGLR